MRNLSFITANYVARALNYSGKSIDEWGHFDQATVANASPESFMAVAQDIAESGFDAIDVWASHCHFLKHDRDDYLEQVKGILSQFDLTITSYAGGIVVDDVIELERPFKFMKQLGAPIFAGGVYGKLSMDEAWPVVNGLCEKYKIKFGYENHPEKTPQEILARAGNGAFEHIGVALDTGWCGTHAMDALEAVKTVRDRLFIIHLKDVQAHGRHDTCVLGDGVVAVEKVVRHLVETDWQGTLCIEHEPFDRDPMPEVKRSVERVKQWLKK